MRIRSLMSAAALAGGLVAVAATPAIASPSPAPAANCTLTVSNLYYTIGMNSAVAKLAGGCSGPIGIVLEQAATPSGPYHEEPDALYGLQQSADGTAATAYFLDPEQRGYCRAKASFANLVAVSASPNPC